MTSTVRGTDAASLRLSNLLGRMVIDVDGTIVGRVHDVRLVQDGPVQSGIDASFRVRGLVVGRASIASRLGYDRGGTRGPWLIAKIVDRLARDGRYVVWSDVADLEADAIQLRVAAGSLGSPPRLRAI